MIHKFKVPSLENCEVPMKPVYSPDKQHVGSCGAMERLQQKTRRGIGQKFYQDINRTGLLTRKCDSFLKRSLSY